ncbi:MAG: SAM-dependent methyltransferase [Sediminibacterium sp.]
MNQSSTAGHLYLIPCYLHDDAIHTIPAYLQKAVANCSVFLVENERSARRFLKKLWKEMVIDNYRWYLIEDAGEQQIGNMLSALKAGQHVGIISEAGCPGIADPGQLMVSAAQEKGYQVIPLVGPSSIVLALMASGLNGQQFSFHGYLPIDAAERKKKIKELEATSSRDHSTQIFIETPYRNHAMINDILASCRPTTRLCVAVDLTGPQESILTRHISEWKKMELTYHKKPAIFLLMAG